MFNMKRGQLGTKPKYSLYTEPSCTFVMLFLPNNINKENIGQ